jgi:L-2-hydroxyglutarate oxidase LhgO
MDVDVVIVGAGAVGLAVAASLARNGKDVLVLEAASAIGTGTSARNSEVIHAGMYYPTGSLKHLMCVAGRRALYAYLQQRNIAHRKCGKLIVATTEAEIAKIEAIHATGLANGVEGLALLSAAEAKALEPALTCTAALWSPETGIIDAHGYMLALQGEIEDHGGAIALQSPVTRVEQLPGGGFRVQTPDAAIECRQLVNSAGLHATRVAGAIEGLAPAHIPQLTLAKGNYFSCAARPVFSRLIYPAPVDGGLGVHVTLDLGGRMKFGPDVEWLATHNPDVVDYTVDPRRADAFYAAIRRYWPGLPDGVILPDYAGCRPKLSGPGEPAADFRIDGSTLHGVPGLVNLFGIESPGLTSSLAIADEVRLLLE